MGQYYHPTSITKEQHLYSHDYHNGLKLMEHSWIGNGFVGAVERLLSPNGPWHKTSFVWAGDYADAEEGTVSEENVHGINLYSKFGDNKIPLSPYEIDMLMSEDEFANYHFIVNHTKKQYVDKRKGIKKHEEDWVVHPLPLLTCEGNGRGGGDYHEPKAGDGDYDKVGMWARDVISVEKEAPEGYEELLVNFYETWER